MFLLGTVGIIAFTISAVTAKNTKNSCPCANPYKQIGYERILDMTECNKDTTFQLCALKKMQQWRLFSGLAGASGGLLVLATVLLRCS
jgi:hypothetical protein